MPLPSRSSFAVNLYRSTCEMNPRHPWVVLAVLVFALDNASQAIGADAFPVAIRVDASRPMGELKPIWRFFGADEPNYAYMKNGQKLLAELGEMRPREVYF